MARERGKKRGHESIALVVDGKDEKWYINKVKDHYPWKVLKEIKVKPELPEKKKVEELRTEAPRIPETDDKHRLNRKEQTDAERSKAARDRLLNNR